MYTGTCALYDMHNPIGDDNGGWACYDRVRKPLTTKSYDRSQGICHNPTGNMLGMWRHQKYDWCKNQCDNDSRCKSFLYAEGDRHMYTGTCQLYDSNNPTADGNGGWACYNKVEHLKAPQYTHHQGICNSPRGVKLHAVRHVSKSYCVDRCNSDPSCHSFIYGEGTRHMYTGTCELYDANNPTADGNTGWSCYDKQEVTYLFDEQEELEDFDIEKDMDLYLF
jgi:hypothetical protein